MDRPIGVACFLAMLAAIESPSAHAQAGPPPDRNQVDDPLPQGARFRMGSVRFRSPDGVMEFFLSKDESTLVSYGPLIIGWDVPTGKELWRTRSPIGYLPASYGMRPIAGLPDGDHFLLAGPNGITRWNARDGTSEVTEFPFQVAANVRTIGSGCRAIDVSENGKRIFVGQASGFAVFDETGVRLYGVEQTPQPVEFNGRDRLQFGGSYAYGRFSPDGKRLAVTMSDHPTEIRIFAAEDGRQLGSLTCTDKVVRMAFTPDSQRLAATERDTAVRLYDADRFQRVWEHTFDVDKRSENYTSALAFSPSGRRLAVCERNQQIFMMDVESGKEVGVIRNHSWNPWAVVFTSDGETLISAGWDGTIHRWSASTLEPLPLPHGVAGTSVASASSDGRRCAYVDQAGVIHLVSTRDGSELSTLQVPNGSFEVVEFSRDGSRLAAGGPWAGKVHVILFHVDDGSVEAEWSWEIGDDPVTGVEEIRFSPDDTKLGVAVFRQDAAHLIDFASGARTRLPHTRVYGLAFAPDGQELVTAGWDKQLKRWNTVTGELIDEKEIPDLGGNFDSRMYTVCSDPLGGQLATAQLGAQIRLWHSDDFSPIRQWKTEGSFTFGALRYSPDGLWLAAGDSGGGVTLWDPSTGEQLHQIRAHENSVYLLSFGKDNRTLCSGGASVAYLWDLRPQGSPPENAKSALEQLCYESGSANYAAWWYLVEMGDPAVELIVDAASKITRVFDIDEHTRNLNDDQRASRERVLRKTSRSAENTTTKRAVRQMVSVLSHINTPDAITALEELAGSESALAGNAAWELKRRAQ